MPFSLHHADGFLDEENPGEGKYSLRLNGKISLPYYWGRWRKERDKAPIQDWFFNTSHHLILKPDTRYRLSFKYRQNSDVGYLEIRSTPVGEEYLTLPEIFPAKKVKGPTGNYNWQEYSFEFDMPSDRSETNLVFANYSENPAWIDAVRIETVGL
ncbi:MAG: hypothetical protein DDT32_00724 [Syntrophomonadaceae bacterium]|nr:hypothetical protein [Bacillota bacterium]